MAAQDPFDRNRGKHRIRLRSSVSESTLNIVFLDNGNFRAWSTAGFHALLGPESARELLAALIKLYPLDALGNI